MANLQVNGVDLAYQQLGEGPDVVLIHGLATNRAFWFAQYALPMSKHFRVTVYDLRGHGYSGRPDSGYDAATMAQDLLGLLDRLGIERCMLVGHSFGGSVAAEFAGFHPGRVSRLVLLDTKLNSLQPEMRMSDSDYLSPFEIEISKTSGHDWASETQVGLLFLEIMARRQLEGAVAQAASDAYTPFGEGRGANRAAKQMIELLDRTTARADFVKPGISATTIAALEIPVLLIYGTASRCMPTYTALESCLPRAERELVTGGGHFFPRSHAETTLARIVRFAEV